MTADRLRALQDGYDRLAREYTVRISGELAHKPFDRDLLDRFAELAAGRGPVLDAGCGPGHVARYLADRGVHVTGLDLSSGMIAQATTLHPDLAFTIGSMTDLPATGELAGIVAFYSIIHVPRDEQPAMFASWRRALRPGGHVLVAFHIGEADRHIEELWGQDVEIDFLFFSRAEIERRLSEVGFTIVESHERDPYPDIEAATRRGYILARNDG